MWSVVVVAKGLWPVTERFLNTLEATIERRHEIIYIDNGSPDLESYNAFLKWANEFKSPHLVDARCVLFNPGETLAHCWNEGLRKALGTTFLVANNDITFYRVGWADRFEEMLHDQNIGITGIVGMSWNDIAFIQGSLFAFRSDVYERIGGFDERFTFTCEDIDFSKRAQDAGYRIQMILPELQPEWLYHESHMTRNHFGDTDLWSTHREQAHISRIKLCYKWRLSVRIND